MKLEGEEPWDQADGAEVWASNDLVLQEDEGIIYGGGAQ